MKFYQGTVSDAMEGICYVWGANKTEVKTRAKKLMSDMEWSKSDIKTAMGSLRINEHKLEAGAKHVTDWLNARFTRDNG